MLIAAAPAGEGLSRVGYPPFFKMSKLYLRFSEFSTLKDKAEKLNL